SGHSTTGIVLILLGIILLVGNMGLIPDSLWGIIFQWPSIFGIIAIINLHNIPVCCIRYWLNEKFSIPFWRGGFKNL
ncbi:MAG: LiaI-LiaF-like domain-containing protein, partial [Marinilabiliaceae bacterium]